MSSTDLPSTLSRPIRLMLVEDCRLVRIGIRAILDEAPQFEVVGEVDSGELALSLTQEAQPDVVLIDLGLPGMSGVETMLKIKQFFSADSIKFVILTTHEQEAEVLQAMEAGAHAYCLKDIQASRLLHVIQSVYEGAVWLDPGVAAFALKKLQNTPSAKGGTPAHSHVNYALKNSLTEREQSILNLLVQGKTNTELSKELFISVHTAKFYVSNLLEKLGVTDRVQAAVKAIREGLVDEEVVG